MPPPLIYGLDFGTTNSAVTIYDNGIVTSVPVGGGDNDMLRSVIFFPDDSEDIYIGFDLHVGDMIKHPGEVVPWVTVDDIQETFDRMIELGAREKYPPKPFSWGETLASLYDPEGNEIGLIERLKEEN